MVFIIPSHTSVTIVSHIINTYLDRLRLLITKEEPEVLSEWTKYAEVQRTTTSDPLRSYIDLLISQRVFKKFTNSHRKQQHFLLYPSILFFFVNYTFPSNPVILEKRTVNEIQWITWTMSYQSAVPWTVLQGIYPCQCHLRLRLGDKLMLF